MEDDVLKEERERAQKLSKNILGQGSFQSSNSGLTSSRYGGFGNTTTSSRASEGLMFDTDTEEAYIDKKFTAFEERILSVKRGNRQEKFKSENAQSSENDWRPFDEDATTPPSTQGVTESGWANFSVSLYISPPLIWIKRVGKLQHYICKIIYQLSFSHSRYPPLLKSYSCLFVYDLIAWLGEALGGGSFIDLDQTGRQLRQVPVSNDPVSFRHSYSGCKLCLSSPP